MSSDNGRNRAFFSLRSCLPVAAVIFTILGTVRPSGAQTTVENWERWEQTLTTTRNYHLNNGNPYRDLILKVTYTPISCSGSPSCQTFTGYGFWDGGNTFKIRSAFPVGSWSWSVTCSGTSNGADCSLDPALDSVLGGTQTTTTAMGTISVVNHSIPGFDPEDPYRYQIPERGFVRVSSDRRYLTYSDGASRFFWQADTAWRPQFDDLNDNTRWNQFLLDRVSRSFTTVLMAIASSSSSTYPADSAARAGLLFEDLGSNCTGATWPKSCSRWKPDYFRKLDEKIRLANTNGLLAVLLPVMDPLGNASNVTPIYPNPADAAIFARNLAARLSGSHVIFSPSFDDPYSQSATLIDWVGCALRDAAPRHLVTAHLAGSSPISDYQTLHNRRWHQFHIFQSGHAFKTPDINPWEDKYEYAVRRARTMPGVIASTTTSGTSPACPNSPAISLPALAAGLLKPNVNGEAAYDHTYVNPNYTTLNSQAVDTPQGVRHTGYYSTLNGASGFTLGVKGIWDWTNITPTTLDGQGSRQMEILGDQFRLMPWEALRPKSTLITQQKTESPGGPLEEDKQVVMAATSDNSFALLYIPDNREVFVNMSSFLGFDCATTLWSRQWVNPRTGLPAPAHLDCSLASGTTYKFIRPSCPTDLNGDSGNCDWILKIRRVGYSAANASSGHGLEVWPEPAADGAGWKIMGRDSRNDGKEPFAVNDPREDGRLLKQPVVAEGERETFLVAWEDESDGDLHGVYLRRVDGQCRLLDREYRVNITIDYDQTNPWIATGPTGGVVTWTSYAQDGELGGIFVRKLNPAGIPFGPEIPVNEHTEGRQDFPKAGMDLQGSFVVAWTSEGQDGDAEGVYARRFDRQGDPLGGEFRVNSTVLGAQFFTALDVSPLGDFSIFWTSYAPDGSELGILGQRYDARGERLGEEFLLIPPSASQPSLPEF